MAASVVRIMLRQNKFLLVPTLWRSVARTLNVSYIKQVKKEEESAIEDNPFYQKYADKIRKLQSSNPEEFHSRLHLMRESSKRAKAGESEQAAKQSLSDQPRPQLKSMKKSGSEQELDSIVKVDLLRKHSAEEITEIWRDFHKDKDMICAVIKSETYSRIQQKAKQYPMFLYPLPRDEGFEFFFAQFENHSCYFTSLINYQAYQENAPALLTLTHYPELQEEKGIVLMRGELDTKLLTVQQAQFFTNQLQLYYATGDESREKLLRDFNLRPGEFKHMDVISQLSNATIS